MSAGRCICGKEDKSCKVIRNHMNSCAEVGRSFAEGRSAEVKDPEVLYREHRDYLASDEGQAVKAERREENGLRYRRESEAKIDASRARFAGDSTP